MIKRTKQLLKCNKGDGIVEMLFIVLTMFMALAILFEGYKAITLIKNIKDNGQQTLDAYTIQIGKEIVSQVKSGNDYTAALNTNLFLRDYYKALDINSNLEKFVDGRLHYKLEDIKASFIFDKSLKTNIRYILKVPLYFIGKISFTINVPINLESRYILIGGL